MVLEHKRFLHHLLHKLAYPHNKRFFVYSLGIYNVHVPVV